VGRVRVDLARPQDAVMTLSELTIETDTDGPCSHSALITWVSSALLARACGHYAVMDGVLILLPCVLLEECMDGRYHGRLPSPLRRDVTFLFPTVTTDASLGLRAYRDEIVSVSLALRLEAG